MNSTFSMRALKTALVMLPVLFMLAGCPSLNEIVFLSHLSGESVPFDRLPLSAPVVGWPHAPQLLVAGSLSEAVDIRGMLSDADAATIDTFDFEHRFLVARLVLVANGYSQRVVDVRQDATSTRIIVRLISPPPNTSYDTMVHPPGCDLLTIDRADLTMTPGTQWEVVTTTGETLATATYPEPVEE